MHLRAQLILKRLKALLAAITIAAAALSTSAASANLGPPSHVIDKFHQSLSNVMRNAKQLGFDGRYARLQPAVTQAFHLGVMVRVIASAHWSKMEEQQRKALVDAFTNLTVATYADRFDGFSGERFQTLDERSAQRAGVWVMSQLVKSDGEKIELNYLMRQFGEEWRVIDIYLKGTYSEVATKRSEYSAILRDQGVNALIDQLNAKAASFRARRE